ncbi:DUF2188 domain-containing protein [Mycoplasma sp. Mirounga ES2805-ORL]|uniref:DUF2188 domain-containing protein n=1 Tax=Mycoplasma sp. Mirounga ES2805-ORL TaxID=754514 RepID=UPI00197C30D2|nr:DUF2188 domain-containing protein [Mycoplasma sp. Mirounga ES2805-ORL]QSF13387.1 DUF2188 domain-containing protein [Mycoplasma sp. Mirounga ES2805-ORL]
MKFLNKPEKEIKKTSNVYHVTTKGNEWQVKKNNSSRATKIFATQKEAIDFANDLSKKSNGTVLIHRKTGRIRDSIKHKKKI